MMEAEINEMQASHRLGAMLFSTDSLRASLVCETKNWLQAYGSGLNDKCGREMDEILAFFDTVNKPLSRPVKDLDDIRTHMAALAEIREAEVGIKYGFGENRT